MGLTQTLTHKMLTNLCLTLCLLAQLSPALPKVGKKPQFSPGQKIVGGNEVEPPHSIPFQVSLQLTEWGDWHFCGGSLLTDRVVVTAAHCCYETDLAGVKVMAGKHDLYAEEDSEQAAGIASTVDVVRPAVTGEQFTGTARVSGWGTLEDGGVAPGMLMSVEVTLKEDSVCRSVYGDEAVVDSMLCAGDTGKDACQGDSGGPLVCRKGETGEFDVLCGLV